jgi:hypothetical protein
MHPPQTALPEQNKRLFVVDLRSSLVSLPRSMMLRSTAQSAQPEPDDVKRTQPLNRKSILRGWKKMRFSKITMSAMSADVVNQSDGARRRGFCAPRYLEGAGARRSLIRQLIAIKGSVSNDAIISHCASFHK